jgi:hydrogenase maturation protease
VKRESSAALATESTGDEAPVRSLLILGLGNVLCGDDGLGVAALARLDRSYELPPGVEMLDGGTLGLALLHYASRPDALIMVDAIRADAPPGSPVRLIGDEVAPAIESRLSVHQVGVADLLDGLRWTGSSPRRIVLIGLVPETLELGLERSPAVTRALPRLVDAIVREAASLGFALTPRPAHATLTSHHSDFAPRALGL